MWGIVGFVSQSPIADHDLLTQMCDTMRHRAVIEREEAIARLVQRFRATTLNTLDGFGSHTYQHHKSEVEIRALVRCSLTIQRC
jgi:hypothetical protein